MPLRLWPARVNDLARDPLVLAPGGQRRHRLLRGAVLFSAMLLAGFGGAAGSHFYWGQGVVPMQAFRLHEQALDRTRLQLEVSQAHARELEHQVDSLNQRLRECLEEATFFRRGRDARR
jgi:hypothetical protein